MIRVKFLTIFILISSFVFSQEDYEILYIKGEYEKVLQNSIDLDSPNDYYWNSLILDKKGNDLKAIEILKDGLNKYANNQMLEKLLVDLLYKTGQYSQAKFLLSEYLVKKRGGNKTLCNIDLL